MTKELLKWIAKYPDAVEYISILYSLARDCKGDCVELGTNVGISTLPLVIGTAFNDKMVYSYDIIDCCNRVKENVQMSLINWKFIVCDSVEAAKNHDDDSLSLLFIDTIHTYGHTKKELNTWLPKMKQRSIICGHDYCDAYPGICQTVDEFYNQVKNNYDLVVFRGTEEHEISFYKFGFFIFYSKNF